MAKPGMLLALAIAVTVQICVVTADEMPMIGDDSIALVEEGLGEAAAPKDVKVLDPEEAALAKMKALKEKKEGGNQSSQPRCGEAEGDCSQCEAGTEHGRGHHQHQHSEDFPASSPVQCH